jgi:nucleotide-binding universal stress UspA family protein
MRIVRIVVGMDFSTTSTDAAKWITDVFAPTAELLLVHVIDLPARPDFLRGSLPTHEAMESAARGFAESRLRDIAMSLGSATARTEIRVGTPHEVLTEAARSMQADLVLVGQHGDRRRPWKPLGTTAERLVRTSRLPVLVVGGSPAAAPRRIVVAVDESDLAPHVLAWTRDLATRFEAVTIVVHVLSNAAVSHVASVAAVTTRDDDVVAESIERAMSEEGMRWLEQLAMTGAGLEHASAMVTFGDAGDAILALAEDSGADLIVLGRRGTGTLLPAVLGSTVSTVLHGAKCPVLVVTEPEDTPGP